MANTPNIGPYTELKPFRFWCQKVLPLVYDESLSYYELLCKVVDYLNKTMEDVDQMIIDMGGFQTAYGEFTQAMEDRYTAFTEGINDAVETLESFINNYFDNLDVQEEINNKIDAMATAGYFNTLFTTLFRSDIITEAGNVTSAWIAENLLQETGYVIDKSLTVENAAADAAATGLTIRNLRENVSKYMDYDITDFSEGKMIVLGAVGEVYSLSDNANSYYTAAPIDVRAYKGGTIKIIKSDAPASSSRRSGFVDSQNKWQSNFDESSLDLTAFGSVYVATIPITGDFFIASFTKANTILKMEFYKANVTEEEATVIKVNDLLIENNISFNSDYYVAGASSNRIAAKKILNPLEYVQTIRIKGVAGYQTTLRFNSGTTSVAAGWISGDWTYINDGTYKDWEISARKSNDDAISAEELSAFVAALEVKIEYKTIRTTIFDTCYVATSGSDSNTGTDRSHPFQTIQRAINAGYKNILVKEGTYSEALTISGKENIYIGLDDYYNAYSAGSDEDKPVFKLNGGDSTLTGVTIADSANITFDHIEVYDFTRNGFLISDSKNLLFKDCVVHDIAVGGTSGGGFMITDSDADFYNCGAYNIGTDTAGSAAYHIDGFNMHGTGTTNFYNCWAYNCEDDGISHHDICYGFIDGGEWYNCGKGGVASPTHGAVVNVKNVYSHDNAYGLYIASDAGVIEERPRILIDSCAFKNNSAYDMFTVNFYKITIWNCLYDTSNLGTNTQVLS